MAWCGPAEGHPYYSHAWPPHRLPLRGAGRGRARPSARSTAACTAAPGFSSGFPLLIAAFTVARPQPLARAGAAAGFRRRAATQTAQDFSSQFPEPLPGSETAPQAASWIAARLVAVRVLRRTRPFSRENSRARPSRSSRTSFAVRQGRSHRAIVVLAHRDNSGEGPGANDNASGTAALIELARIVRDADRRRRGSRAEPHASSSSRPTAARSAAWEPALRGGISVPGPRRCGRSTSTRSQATGPRDLAFAGDRPRSALSSARPDGVRPDRRADARRAARPSPPRPARRPRVPVQPLRAGAVRRPGNGRDDAHDGRGPAATGLWRQPTPRTRTRGSAQIGRAAQTLLGSLDQRRRAGRGHVELPLPRLPDRARVGRRSSSSSRRSCRSWRRSSICSPACRRRHIPLVARAPELPQPAGFWIFAARLFELFALLGDLGHRSGRPLAPELSPGTDWPVVGLAARSRASSPSPGSSRATGCCRAGLSAPRRSSPARSALCSRSRRLPRLVAMNPYSRSSSFFRRSTRGSGCRSCAAGPQRLQRRCWRQGSQARCSARLVRLPVRPRSGRAVVPRRARRDRLRPLCRSCSSSARGSRVAGAADRARRGSLRAVPERGGTAAPRAGPARSSGACVLTAGESARRRERSEAAPRQALEPQEARRDRRPTARVPRAARGRARPRAAARTIMCDSCPLQRVEHRPASSWRAARGRARPAPRSARARGQGVRARSAGAGRLALEREQRRPDEELEPDERRDRVSRAARRRAPSEHAERDRLSRLDRDAPEDLLDPELGRDLRDEVVRPDGDAAGGDEHVGLEPALERRAVRGSSSATGPAARPRRLPTRAGRRASRPFAS